MKTFTLSFIFLILFLTSQVNGQVAINTDGSAPHASAMLDVTSISRGFLPPRMTSAQKGAILNKESGLLIYQTDNPIGYYFWNGNAWVLMGTNTWTTEGVGFISYDGYVSIGGLDDTYKLFVTHNLNNNYVASFENTYNSATSYGIKIRAAQNNGTKSTSNQFIGLYQGTNHMGSLTYDGAGNLVLAAGSDSRLKTNIQDTKISLNDLMKIQVRDFNWINSNKPSTGFIAQELNEVYPMAVSIPEDDKEYWMVSSESLIPLLVKSIQDQQKIINSQDVKIKSLEDRISAIENSLAK